MKETHTELCILTLCKNSCMFYDLIIYFKCTVCSLSTQTVRVFMTAGCTASHLFLWLMYFLRFKHASGHNENNKRSLVRIRWWLQSLVLQRQLLVCDKNTTEPVIGATAVDVLGDRVLNVSAESDLLLYHMRWTEYATGNNLKGMNVSHGVLWRQEVSAVFRCVLRVTFWMLKPEERKRGVPVKHMHVCVRLWACVKLIT